MGNQAFFPFPIAIIYNERIKSGLANENSHGSYAAFKLLPCMGNNEYKERLDYALELIDRVYKCLTLEKLLPNGLAYFI